MANSLEDYGSLFSDDRDRITMLDRALEDATPEQKARVREVVRRLGIEDDNEFYIVVIAIGYLIILVKDAPERWQALFDAFEERLLAWSKQNLRTLSAINRQSDLTERMSSALQSLATSTTSLSDETKASQTRLTRLNDSLERLTQKLDQMENSNRELALKLNAADSRVRKLESLVTSISGCSLGLLLAMFIGGGLAYRHLARQNHFVKWVVANETERSEWLLEKANREECWFGIKPQSDPQCQ